MNLQVCPTSLHLHLPPVQAPQSRRSHLCVTTATRVYRLAKMLAAFATSATLIARHTDVLATSSRPAGSRRGLGAKRLRARSAIRMTSSPPPPPDGSETTMEMEEGALDLSGDAEVVRPDLRLASTFTFVGGFLVYNGTSWTVLGLPLLVFGAFLYLQTARIRFVFGPTKLNVASRSLSTGELSFIRGWAYDQIAVWDIYPAPQFPILAYFRERESYEGRGSIHFFPILADGQQLIELLQSRTGQPRG